MVSRAQISIDMIASVFVYMLALTLVITTAFRSYGLLSNSNFAERADLMSDKLSLMLTEFEGSPNWESDPTSAGSIGFADGNSALSYEKMQSFAGLGVSEARWLLGITYDHRMKISYMPSIVIDVSYDNPKMVVQGTAPLNAFSPGEVNITITTYDGKSGRPVGAKTWVILSSSANGKAGRSDSADGLASAIMVAPPLHGKAVEAKTMAEGRYRVSYEVTAGGIYTLKAIALKNGNAFGEKEVTVNVA